MSKLSLSLAVAVSLSVCASLVAADVEQPSLPPKLSAEEAFQRMDKNKDGKLSKGEFTENFRDPITAAHVFEKADQNKDGFLTLDEFKAGGDRLIPRFKEPRKKPGNQPPKVSAEEAFKRMDKDKDGKLSKDEFTRNWPDAKKAGQLFDQADKNKDGALTLDEFKAGGDKMIPQFATTLDAGNAKPPPKKKTPQQHAKTRVEAAMTVLNDAKKKLDEAKRHAKDEAEKSRHAESEAEAARKSLREIEAKLEEMQPSQSAFGKARDAFKAAGQAYHAAENRALNASEYKAAYQHAMDASDGPALASLRKETLAKDAAVRQTLATLEAAKAVYEPMQVELFDKDPQWQKTRQKVLDKERAIRDREGRAKGAISEVRRARAKVQEAENMLEAAMQAVPYTGAHRRR